MEQLPQPSRAFRSIVHFTVYANIWISIGAGLWTLATQWVFELPLSYASVAFVGFATLFTYNFQRLVKPRTSLKSVSLRSTWIARNKNLIVTLSIIGAAGTLVSFLYLPLAILWLMIPFGIISLGYAIEFLPTSNRRLNLRSLPGLKIILISLTWAVSTVFVPLIESGIQIEGQHFIYTLERFLFVLAITIPFDIRDLKFDESTMKTLPQVLGIRYALWLAILLLAICALLDFWLFGIGIFSFPVLVALLFSYCVAAWFITLTTNTRQELYFTGAIDGLFTVQTCCLALVFFIQT